MGSLPVGITVLKGDFDELAPKVKAFIAEKAKICKPDSIHILDGSDAEYKKLIHQMEQSGMLVKLKKYESW